LDLEELILRYYLSLFSIFLLFFYFVYLFHFKSLIQEKNIIKIDKGDSINEILNLINNDLNFIEKNIYFIIMKISNNYLAQLNYGKFIFNDKKNFFEIINIISKKSNIDYKITIVEGWQEFQLRKYLIQYYEDYKNIPYENLLSETYIINSSNSFNDLENFLLKNKDNFFKKYKNNYFYKKYTIEEILIISSLVEKEAKNNEDKGLIASVIFNRLDINMPLQIDATVIYALTEGKSKLNRKLNYNDLKYNHPYNTYLIKGIPPGMISYVGKETVKLVLESDKSDFLFYFYNILEKKHIFSKNFEKHKMKLNEYKKRK